MSSKEDIMMGKNTWRDIQCHSLLEKCTSKLQWDISPHSGQNGHNNNSNNNKNLQTTSAGEGVEKRGPSYITGGNINWYSHYGRQYGDSLQKLEIKSPYDPAVPL